MKRLFLNGFLALALAWVRVASAADAVYENDGQINSPPDVAPQVDATNFINNGLINIALNSFVATNSTIFSAIVLNTSILPFDFSDVQSYTNRGQMLCDTGFRFDTAPSGNGPPRHMAASFGNANGGQISAGSFTNSFTSLFVFFTGIGQTFGTGTPQIQVSATNIINTGLLDVGFDGFISVSGQTVNLDRGTVHVEGFDDFDNTTNNVFNDLLVFGAGFTFDLGIFGNYTGIGFQTNELDAATLGTLTNFASPTSLVTNNQGLPGIQTVIPPNASAFAFTSTLDPSNMFTQVVYINTNLSNISVNVRYANFGPESFALPVIQWQAVVTNSLLAPPVTNSLYLSDGFGVFTNFQDLTNSSSLTGVPLLAPFNYSLTRTFTGFSNFTVAPNTQFSPVLFASAGNSITNEYTAFGVSIAPTTFTVDGTAAISSITNLPGRVLINAGQSLDLTRAIISGPNYLRLTATNHFVGSSNAQIIYPNADIFLGTTNGQLAVSNLVAPYVPRFQGPIQIYSARWTNIVAGVTNHFHILIVDGELTATSPVLIQNLSLRSTNIVISDLVNVASNLFIDATSLTITSNAPGTLTPSGEINLLSSQIIWSSSLSTNLQNVTNSGIINTGNTVFFQRRATPNYPSASDGPYKNFVNHGDIFDSGSIIWANYFENTGLGPVTNSDLSVSNYLAFIVSSFGPITVQATNAVMANGAFIDLGGDISIASGSLSISNHALQTSGMLTLTATSLLTDTGTNSSNFWQVSDGINLPIKPVAGDLLGTTITSTCPANLEVDNLWAGEDRGLSVTGFQNNAALGHLILDGGSTSSTFFFSGPGATNAIYIDLIELKDGATNRAPTFVNGQIVQTYTAVDVNPGMTVYFADAMANGEDISEKLNGNLTESGGQVIWVPAYAGFFSSTNVTYPSGKTYSLNRALVESIDIDSNDNGTNNAFDPAPVFVSEDVNLSVYFTNNPARIAVITWDTLANATNNLFTSTSLVGTNWSLVTNFVKNTTGPVSVTNSAPGNGPQYYKVRIDPTQP